MSERLSRKEIKRDIREDEVKNAITQIFDWIYENGRLLAYAGVGLVVLVIAAFAGAAYLDRREAAASEQLAAAIELYQSPLIGEETEDAPPVDVDVPRFTSAEERRGAAREAFTALRERAGSGAAGDVAGLYLAEIAAREGDVETARELWQEFVDEHGDHLLATAARINLISLDRQDGRADEVAEALREEIASGTGSLPMDVALYELARTLEALEQDEEAQLQYQRLVDEHGNSPYAAEARRVLGEA